jgi:hypothetical protein
MPEDENRRQNEREVWDERDYRPAGAGAYAEFGVGAIGVSCDLDHMECGALDLILVLERNISL